MNILERWNQEMDRHIFENRHDCEKISESIERWSARFFQF